MLILLANKYTLFPLEWEYLAQQKQVEITKMLVLNQHIITNVISNSSSVLLQSVINRTLVFNTALKFNFLTKTKTPMITTYSKI